MPHRDSPDLRRLRADTPPAPAEPPPAEGQPALLLRVAAGSVPTAGRFLTAQAATITGPAAEGGPATLDAPSTGPLLPVYYHGVEGDPRLTGPLAAGDFLVADAARYRLVAWSFPPPNPRQCFDCQWPTTGPWPTLTLHDPAIAAAVDLTSTDGKAYEGCVQATLRACDTGTHGGPLAGPIWYRLDLTACTLTASGWFNLRYDAAPYDPTQPDPFLHPSAVPGYTCADHAAAPKAAGDFLLSWTAYLAAARDTPLELDFADPTIGSDGRPNDVADFYGTTAANSCCTIPAPTYKITGPDLGPAPIQARCLGTRGELPTTLTLGDPHGTAPTTLTYGSGWPLPVHASYARGDGWWGCGTVAVPDRCNGGGTITVPVAYFLNRRTCGFLVYYKAATLDATGDPTDGCADELAPRAGSCSGGDGPGDSWGIAGATDTTLLPVLGPSMLTAATSGAGATWIEVDSYDPLALSVTLDAAAAKLLYGSDGPVTLSLTEPT